MTLRFTAFFVLLFLIRGNAQIWQKVFENDIVQSGTRDITPQKFEIYDVNDSLIKQKLWSAPHEKTTDVSNSNVLIEVMNHEGTSDSFRIVQYDMMEAPLALKYADIRTFYGVCTKDILKRIRIDYTVQGFRAVVYRPGEGRYYIDHYQRNDLNHRIVYHRKDYVKRPTWGCMVQDQEPEDMRSGTTGSRIGDCQLRSYRLAQATTGEYSNYHGATGPSQAPLVMSAVVNVINRINEVYEAEVAVRLLLVSNTDQIFYYNPASDPYTNNDGGTMLGENIATCNSVIGSANYDIGHVFSTGGGGVAYLASVCTTNKAGGVTGSGAPVGDPFTIDYVAHEMGHQFNGAHTQYNNCNRSPNSAMEPGSASTIMGYAGICSPNVQNNSDAYFHGRSLEQIKTFLTGTGNGCSQIISTFVNTAPSVTTQSNRSIPVSTPFQLTLAATDNQGHPITYAWEQMNAFTSPAQAMPPASTNTSGPVFRSIDATTSPTRYFPPLTNVINNTANTWQVLPSVARSMSFRGIARDFTGVAGCNNEINITVSTVNASAGAFSVTSFNTPTTWQEGESRTITWNVAGSNVSPVSAPNVDILLSYDGGNTYPVSLAAATPNDGSHAITVPTGTTTQGRVMVRGTNHIFYDINNANITITQQVISFNLSASPSQFNVCQGGQLTSQVLVTPIGNFTQPVTLSATGLPPGASATFSVNPVTPGNTSVVTISGFNSTGTFTTTVNGVSGSISKTTNLSITVNGTPGTVLLSAPANNATNVAIRPALSWTAVTNASSYELQLAYDNTFSDNVLTTTVSGTTHNILNPLYGGTGFFWRVRAISTCGTGSWSSTRTFTTEPCWVYQAQNMPLVMPGGNTEDSFSSLEIKDRGTTTDIDIYNVTGDFGLISFLTFEIGHATAASVLWNQPCGKDSIFNIGFDDASTNGFNWPCPPNDGLMYQPTTPLSTLNNLALQGDWTLRISKTDSYGGTLDDWKLKACATSFCRLKVDHGRSDGPGSLREAINCAMPGDTILFSGSLINDTIQLGSAPLVINKSLYILGNISDNIHIFSNSPGATIQNTTAVSSEGLTIRGVHIHASSGTSGAIENAGKLTLENVILHKWPGSAVTTITTQANAQTILSGNCEIVD